MRIKDIKYEFELEAKLMVRYAELSLFSLVIVV
jgi:hypothetical protein